MLYRPEAFEPLTDETWDAGRVREAIRAIVVDVDAAYGGAVLWPADERDGWQAATPMKNLYVGAAGVVWALDELRRRGLAETRFEPADVAEQALESWREKPDFVRALELPAQSRSALLTGESGLLLVAWRLTAKQQHADELAERVAENLDNEANELMWGTPGTLFAAQAMVAATGEDRWRSLRDRSTQAVLRSRDPDGLWTQRLYGKTRRTLGPAHGLVGNVHALGAPAQLAREANDVLVREAVVEAGLANWPMFAGGQLVSPGGEVRLQWCHGAPGIVAAAADYLDEELLLAGAELVWRAGAHGPEKGPSICHGTAGNGYALLTTFGRTGDERWLERARRFAVHALEQVRRRGHGRYSLWTGDLGVALYAADCLEGRAAYPVLDYSA